MRFYIDAKATECCLMGASFANSGRSHAAPVAVPRSVIYISISLTAICLFITVIDCISLSPKTCQTTFNCKIWKSWEETVVWLLFEVTEMQPSSYAWKSNRNAEIFDLSRRLALLWDSA